MIFDYKNGFFVIVYDFGNVLKNWIEVRVDVRIVSSKGNVVWYD